MGCIYFLTKDDKIIDNYAIAAAAKIVHNRNISPKDWDEIRRYTEYCRGIQKEIVPSLDEFLKRGQRVQAIQYYKDFYPHLTLKQCKEVVEKIAAWRCYSENEPFTIC